MLAFIAAKLVMLAVLGVNTAFIMDEYWIADQALRSPALLYQDIVPAKTQLYAAFFRIAHWLADAAAQVMLTARLQGLALTGFGLGLVYLIALNIGRSRLEALFILCVILAFSSFMERAFMVRPEPLATVFALAALWVATQRRQTFLLCFAAGLLSGLAFLATQKAVYFNLALGLALIGDGFVRRAFKEAVLSGAVLVLGWAVVVLAYGLFFALYGAEFMEVLRQVFFGATVKNAIGGHVSYGSLRWLILQTLIRNTALYVLCVTGWGLALVGLARLSGPERRALIFSGVISVLVFAHPAPWPYNLIMAIPFLGLWSTALPRLVRKGPAAISALFGGVVAVVLVLSFARNVHYLDHDNRFQNETVRLAETLLGPDDAYADGIGMVVTRRLAGSRWRGQVVSWDRLGIGTILGLARRGNLDHIEAIIEGSPKVWILSYRTALLESVLEPYLRNSYVAISSNVLISGVKLIAGEETMFQNRWEGSYRLYRADGSPAAASLIVDGKPVTGGARLGTGSHSLRFDVGRGPLYLLPADIEVPFTIPRRHKQRVLFDRVYTF
jgi:hypothetical protein